VRRTIPRRSGIGLHFQVSLKHYVPDAAGQPLFSSLSGGQQHPQLHPLLGFIFFSPQLQADLFPVNIP
jgi:hypothetical protein